MTPRASNRARPPPIHLKGDINGVIEPQRLRQAGRQVATLGRGDGLA
jgi:hypothetical protein